MKLTDDNYNLGLQEFDGQIEKVKAQKELAEKLNKLVKTDEWKEVIEKEYYENEADRLVKGLTNSNNLLKREVVENMTDMIISIRNFKKFIGYVLDNGLMADDLIEDIKDQKEAWAKEYQAQMKAQAENDEVIDVEAE